MNIKFIDFNKKEELFKKQLIEWCFLPRIGEGIVLKDGRLARVMDVVYELNNKTNDTEFYEEIAVLVEVFEKEKS